MQLNAHASHVLVEFMRTEQAVCASEPGNKARQERAIEAWNLVFGAAASERLAEHFVGRRDDVEDMLRAAEHDAPRLLEVMGISAEQANTAADRHADHLDSLIGAPTGG